MPRTTLSGDDPGHDLPKDEKDRLERKLREEAEAVAAPEGTAIVDVNLIEH